MTANRRELDRFAKRCFAPATLAATATLPAMGTLPRIGLGSAVQHALVRVVETVSTWHEHARQRRALMALSDPMLRDIGISRPEAQRESTKPFWLV